MEERGGKCRHNDERPRNLAIFTRSFLFADLRNTALYVSFLVLSSSPSLVVVLFVT